MAQLKNLEFTEADSIPDEEATLAGLLYNYCSSTAY